MTIVTTIMGTIIGWLLNAIKTNTGQLYNMSRREHEERVQNRAMLGELLFYRLEDLHRRFVIEGHPCSAAEKQQVDDIPPKNSRSTKIAVKVLKNVFDFLALMLVFLLNL